MVNDQYIHLYKNRYNKLTPINTFSSVTLGKQVNGGTTCSNITLGRY